MSKSKHGQDRIDICVTVSREQFDAIKNHVSQFGLSPVQCARNAIFETLDQDSFDWFDGVHYNLHKERTRKVHPSWENYEPDCDYAL